jgi:hypothetical protein
MESRFEAVANKEFFNRIGDSLPLPRGTWNDRNALADIKLAGDLSARTEIPTALLGEAARTRITQQGGYFAPALPSAVVEGKISDLITTGTAPDVSNMAPMSM